jgi:hypothetical protein
MNRDTNDLHFDGELLSVPLWYPRQQDPNRTMGHPVRVEVDLVCVRAARAIRIEYDFDRNGYVITVPTLPAGHTDDHDCDWVWVEAAFVDGELGL